MTSGEYSDYRINGVFSTRDKSVEFVGNSREGEFTIEEYGIDSEPCQLWGPYWEVYLNIDGNEDGDGDSEWPERNIPVEYRQGERGESVDVVPTYNCDSFKMRFNPDRTCFLGKSYVSHDHALKLAIEARQKCLRERPYVFDRSFMEYPTQNSVGRVT